MRSFLSAREIARRLASRIVELVVVLLPAGHRESAEWRCGSVAGEPGDSLGVHLTGTKAGVWADFSAGQKGDALDLVRIVLGLDMPDAIEWSLRWLGTEDGDVWTPDRHLPNGAPMVNAKSVSDYTQSLAGHHGLYPARLVYLSVLAANARSRIGAVPPKPHLRPRAGRCVLA